MKFTQLPSEVFKELQLNAGVLVSGSTGFVPSTGTLTEANIIGATSGGISFTATPSFQDFGEDIDNCPKNTKELKKITGYDVKMTGSFVSMTGDAAKTMVGAADKTTSSTLETITPRADLASADFEDIWFVGDYSDKNGATNGGFIAIHMLNGLSTGGFQIQTTDNNKGKFAFEFTGHVSIGTPSVVPFVIYVKAGTAEL